MHLSLICMIVRLGWTDCDTFVSYLYDSKARDIHVHLSHFYDSKAWVNYTFVSYFMRVRLGWTDCHTFVSYLYDSKARVD